MSDITNGHDRLIRIQQANLLVVQSQRISQLEIELVQAYQRIRELEAPKPSDQAKKEAQA